jgi:hypothetical protein
VSVKPFERPGPPNLCRGHNRVGQVRIAVTVPVLVAVIVA